MFNFNEKTTSTDLMDELERFIVYWLGPRHESYGEPAESLDKVQLPTPLRRLYAFAGRWPGRDGVDEQYGVNVFSTQDVLLRPSRLKLTNDGRAVFIVENQAVWTLATLTTGDDPPVWMDDDNVGIEKCHLWRQVSDSLTKLLVTFCFQELTFGAKIGVWDEDLTTLFRSGQAKVTPLWLNGPYVYGDSTFNFYLMDDDVLVGDYGTVSDQSCFFGANSDCGIARIQANESPIVNLRLSTPTDWNIAINPDGSGEIEVFTKSDSKAKLPAGTFDFASLLRKLLACVVERGAHRTPHLYVFRSGRGYAEGRPVSDVLLVRQVFDKAIAAAIKKGSQFDACCRDIPLGVD